MIGIAASIIVNTAFLVLLAFAGTVVIKILPEYVKSTFTYVLPALFGGVLAQFAILRFSSAIFALVVSAPIILVLSIPGFLKTPLAIFLTIGFSLMFEKYSAKKNN